MVLMVTDLTLQVRKEHTTGLGRKNIIDSDLKTYSFFNFLFELRSLYLALVVL